jgi:hypothetical protein
MSQSLCFCLPRSLNSMHIEARRRHGNLGIRRKAAVHILHQFPSWMIILIHSFMFLCRSLMVLFLQFVSISLFSSFGYSLRYSRNFYHFHVLHFSDFLRLFWFWLRNHWSLSHFLCSNNSEQSFNYINSLWKLCILPNTFTSCAHVPISIQFFKTRKPDTKFNWIHLLTSKLLSFVKLNLSIPNFLYLILQTHREFTTHKIAVIIVVCCYGRLEYKVVAYLF